MLALLSGCSAALVPYTSDPNEKLKQARFLFDEKTLRPLPAERLIREAIEIYQTSGNERGLADGYVAYAQFYKSNSVGRWHRHYQDHGFLEPGAVFDKRWVKAIEYFQKARSIYENESNYPMLTFVDESIGLIYTSHFDDNKNGCPYLEMARIDSRKFKEKYPDREVGTVPNYNHYEDYIVDTKKKYGC